MENGSPLGLYVGYGIIILVLLAILVSVIRSAAFFGALLILPLTKFLGARQGDTSEEGRAREIE